ncbi:A/G-specific adenine glycosylase [Algirhabdus cladophorae]|uniref:A/G-specific adenine glycosylase n=1 Tax=Algirhabdus cladophorae TaxID=3377108 RepID=UPI003B84A0C8
MSKSLLAWYDKSAREMPWRVGPAERRQGVQPDPYRIWLSEVMLQQTTVAAVKSYFIAFTSRWPKVTDLAEALDADVMSAWAGLGYYARARNLLKCARVIASEHDGVFPQTYEALIKLPGIGPYTASAISAIAFDAQSTVVDGNVERVVSRLYDIHTPLPASKPEITAKAEDLTPPQRPGDYAQAIMDLGATICTPRNPVCGLCPWRAQCAGWAAGTHTELPKKTPKTPKPTRLGYAYVVRREDGAILLETRPDKGLLGGMLGWPCSDWNDAPEPAPPVTADWTEIGEEARHTFTHFHLRLKVLCATVDQNTTPETGNFVGKHQFMPKSLPTVMRKVWDLAKPTQG